ncbi:hypothetical protein [Rhizobium rhizosphaerae]|uniref:hypothetical protein n=1 Tax=Xaviernesmea rhizosphaerae TaxID=1672749 RepID=UPI000A5C16C3|nr:hypothetical protein [Xaviernesmea rhizosphaerae]
MNPRFSDLIKTLITIGATMVLADTKLSPDDINARRRGRHSRDVRVRRLRADG